MKYTATIDTNDYKDFKFFEDAFGKYLAARDMNAEPGEWLPLHFIKVESEESMNFNTIKQELNKKIKRMSEKDFQNFVKELKQIYYKGKTQAESEETDDK